jgi:hypothetical protein
MTNEHIELLGSAKVSWLYPIYVPSYSRAGEAPLLEMLKDANASVRAKVHVVVRPSEVKSYARAYPWATIVSEQTPGIGPARMRCMVDATERGYGRITVLDDDIVHVSLLEHTERPDGKNHTRRYSNKVSGIREPYLLVRSLAVACRLADGVFAERPAAAYGAARNALFSGDVDVSVCATLNKGSFPACVMFFDVARFAMRKMPLPYQYHGEDLAMFLDTLSGRQEAFTLTSVAYDQHGGITSTIPLDPLSTVGRPHLSTTDKFYPEIHPFLRVSMKNKLGGVMRIGINWIQWYKATHSEPVIIPLSSIINKETT